MNSRIAGLVLLFLMAAQAPARMSAQMAQGSGAYPPATFTDADRRARLAAAFPEIDELIEAFMTR